MTGKKIILTLVLLVLPATVAIYLYSKSTEVRDTTSPSKAPGVPAPQLVKLMEDGEGKASTAVKGGTRGTPAQRSGRQTPEAPGSQGVRRPIMASLPQAAESKSETQASAPVTPVKEENPAAAVKEEARRTAALPGAHEEARAVQPTTPQESGGQTPEHSGAVFVRRPIMASLPQAAESKTETQASAPVTPVKEKKPFRPSTESRDSQDKRTSVGRGEEQPRGPSKEPVRPDSRARRVYRVRAGDCLATIASSSEVYGNFSMWKALYLANPEVIDYVYYRKMLPYAILEADLELRIPELSEARRLMDVIPSSRPLIIKLAESSNLTEMLRLAVTLKRVGHQIYIQELPSTAGPQYVVKLGFFKSKKEARNVLKGLPVEIHRDQCAVLRASENEMREHLPFARRETD